MAALTGKGQQKLVAAVVAPHAGKAVVRVAAVEVPVNDLLQIGPPEIVLPGEMLVIDPKKLKQQRVYFEPSAVLSELPVNPGNAGERITGSPVGCSTP
jgi:hypothetical protein